MADDHQRKVTKAGDVTATLLSWCPPSILFIYVIGATHPRTFSFYISGSYVVPGASQHGHFTLINCHVISHWRPNQGYILFHYPAFLSTIYVASLIIFEKRLLFFWSRKDSYLGVKNCQSFIVQSHLFNLLYKSTHWL